MAKKKNTPVLRAGGGGQDPAKTKSYCIRDDWKDSNKVNYVAFKSVGGDVQDLTVNGEPAGGGGRFAPVTVNVSNSSQADVQIDMPVVYNNKVVPEWFFDADSDDDYQIIAPSIGYIDTVTQQIQISSVTGSGSITVTTVSSGVYQLNINGAGGIAIS